MLNDTAERLAVKVQVGGKRVLWSARLVVETVDDIIVSEDVVAYDELQFDTLPGDSIEDARRIGSAVEVVLSSLHNIETPARITFDVTNYNHGSWETETLQ
jgi:hypothetical protein